MKLFDRVQFSTTTTGTSDITGIAAFRSSIEGDWLTPAEAGVANGDVVSYIIRDGSNWAKGRGIYSSTGPTLARDANEVRWNGSVMSTAKLSLSGTAKVFFSPLAAILALRPEVLSQASASSLTPDVDNYSVFRFTALAANLTIAAPTGTPYDGQSLLFEFRDDGPSRTLTWNAAFGGGTLPANTGDSAVYQRNVLFKFNASRAKWVLDRTWDEAAVYATIGYVGGKTANNSGGSNPSAAINGLTGGSNTSPSAGDLILACLVLDGTSDLTLAMSSSGYTKLVDLYSNDTNDTNLALFYKYSDGSETTCVGASQTGRTSALTVQVWRNVELVSPFDVTETTATGTNTALANPPSITPLTTGNIIVACGGAAATNPADFTSSDLSNFLAANSTITNGAIAGMGSKSGTAAGATFDPAAFGGPSVNANDSWAAVTVALRPKALN